MSWLSTIQKQSRWMLGHCWPQVARLSLALENSRLESFCASRGVPKTYQIAKSGSAAYPQIPCAQRQRTNSKLVKLELSWRNSNLALHANCGHNNSMLWTILLCGTSQPQRLGLSFQLVVIVARWNQNVNHSETSERPQGPGSRYSVTTMSPFKKDLKDQFQGRYILRISESQIPVTQESALCCTWGSSRGNSVVLRGLVPKVAAASQPRRENIEHGGGNGNYQGFKDSRRSISNS